MDEVKEDNWFEEWRRRHTKESWVYRWFEANSRYEETKAALERNPGSAVLDAAAMDASGDVFGIEMAMSDELALMLRRAAKLQPESIRPLLRELFRDIVVEFYQEFDEFKQNLKQQVHKIVTEERRAYMEARRARRELKGIS